MVYEEWITEEGPTSPHKTITRKAKKHWKLQKPTDERDNELRRTQRTQHQDTQGSINGGQREHGEPS